MDARKKRRTKRLTFTLRKGDKLVALQDCRVTAKVARHVGIKVESRGKRDSSS